MVELEIYELEMEEIIDRFQGALTQIRTSGANPNLVSNIEVDYYEMRIVKDIEKAIVAANIGLTPQNEGTQIRIVVPPLTEERRREYALKVKEMGEEAKIALRNVRRSANDAVKKDKTIPEDTQKDMLDEIQEMTDDSIKKVEEIAANKSRDLMKL